MNESFAAIALLCFVSSITPGPNNLLATASGARFGLRRTLPQVAGVTFGFTVLFALAAFGVAASAAAYPRAVAAVSWAGYGYLAWLSWRLLGSAWRPRTGGATLSILQPMRFLESAAFQFANPKAWMMALSAATAFLASGPRSPAATAALAATIAAINFPCVGAWAWMGAALKRWLFDARSPWRARAFDGTMGLLLVATIGWMVAAR